MCELPWFFRESSVSCYSLCYSCSCIFFEEFLIHDSCGFVILKKIWSNLLGALRGRAGRAPVVAGSPGDGARAGVAHPSGRTCINLCGETVDLRTYGKSTSSNAAGKRIINNGLNGNILDLANDDDSDDNSLLLWLTTLQLIFLSTLCKIIH